MSVETMPAADSCDCNYTSEWAKITHSVLTTLRNIEQ
jgi:hypothetical protein